MGRALPFLGAAFVAVGLVSAAFATVRRKHDSLLIYFSLFAAFYGLRLWIQSRLLGMTVHGSIFYTRLRSGIDYIVLIPAFLFLTSLGLPKRFERAVGYGMAAMGGTLAAANFLFGDFGLYHLINNIAVIAAMSFFLIRFMTDSSAERSSPVAADLAVVRWGLMIFVAFVVWENIAGLLARSSPKVEPFGFAVFLSTLGYVAARRTLQRD